MSVEPFRVYEWLNTVLGGDATLSSLATGGVWRQFAPQGTTGGYVVYQVQSNHDTAIVSLRRLWNTGVYAVQFVGPRTLMDSNIKPGADRIDTLLQLASGTTSDGGTIWYCARQQVLAYDELVPGSAQTIWTHLGGLYEIACTAT